MDGPRAARLALLIPALALAGWSLLWGAGLARTDSADLLRRVEEVALFRDRLDPYTDPDLTYPPSALPVFAGLLAPLPAGSEPTAWLALNVAAAIALILGLRAAWGRGWDVLTFVLVACWVVAARPTRAGLALGQFHLIPTALAVWTIPCLSRGRDALAGLLLGLALIKPTMALPLWMVWVARGLWRPATVAAGVQLTLTLAASAWLGRAPWTLFAGFVANARGQTVSGSLDLPGLLGRAGVPEQPALLAGGVLLLLAAGVAYRTRGASIATTTALALATAAVFTYHRHYDLVLLLPPVVALAAAAPRLRPLALGVALLLIPPTHPGWIRPLAPALDALVAAAAYGLAFVLAILCRDEALRGPDASDNATARSLDASGDRAVVAKS